MRKIAVVFLVTVSVLVAGILAVSCNAAVKEEFGTVFIDIGALNASRAVGENGLPIPASSEMTLKVTRVGGSLDESLITEKNFAASEPKTLSLTLPVGEKIKVRVRVKNVTAQWYGESAVHTVTAGSNTISVKLKKSAVVMNSLRAYTGY